MPKTHFRRGDHVMICDVSGFKYHASEMRERWDGKWVHKSVWEPRHPQDFVRSVADKQSVTDARPPVDEFAPTQNCTYGELGNIPFGIGYGINEYGMQCPIPVEL